ncbi:Phenylacetate-coenzyme A ligase PaaK, adenylate-forming domain family [Halogranum rubrum]|uniref:Phenylacetate-coenzyme A ligase PaaK, adenylate-forming domain family n=1 Tax=Halogranum rubrum TaxID=553466 RepID=A0A1I4HRT3_9EURY|nr:phenylacetate--CoA ligase family protein [Halogranum rubrum]SFL44949.1 Phenylacetate-coenzyme A ligase PaaK, adenylate-forming domain family [Halogranum rubrum]
MKPIERGKVTLDAWRARGATRAEIEARQRRRLAEMLSFARRQSRFYKQHYADVPEGSDLTQYPPVTKSMLMEHFDDVVTDTAITKAEIDAFVADETKVGERYLGMYPVWTTSGTTGEPGIFVQDETAWTISDVLGDRWVVPAMVGISPLSKLVTQNLRIALIAVSGGHFAGAAGLEMMRRESVYGARRLRLFSPKSPIDDLISALNQYQPAILEGYSTVFVELARGQQDGRLDISPALVLPTAEPISETQKQMLRDSFDCVVRELYGATEFVPIAVECEHGNLHANIDWVVVEPVDENYQPIERGTPSDTVLITNLSNRVQPLVRYDLGDSITMYEERCPCGSAFPIMEVGGRQGDVLQFETDEGEAVPIFPLALSSVVEEVPGVHRTQIIRTAPTTLQVRFDVTPGATEEKVWKHIERELQSFLRTHGISRITVETASEPPQREKRSEKFRHVWSELEE